MWVKHLILHRAFILLSIFVSLFRFDRNHLQEKKLYRAFRRIQAHFELYTPFGEKILYY